MANAPYAQGTVSVSGTATLICSPGGGSNVVIQNGGSAAVLLGGPTVTATGATAGISLAAAGIITIPVDADAPHDLWGITASSTAAVSFLYPA